MQVHDRAARKNDADTYGRYFLRLQQEKASWMRRRVESVNSISRNSQEVSYSFDLDLGYISEVARDCRVPIGGMLLVPLLNVSKSALFDIDVRDREGRSLNILRRGENSFLSHAGWLAAKQELGEALQTRHFEAYETGFAAAASSVSCEDTEAGAYRVDFGSYDLIVVVPVDKSVIGSFWKSKRDPAFTVLKLRQLIPSNDASWQGGRLKPFLTQRWPIETQHPEQSHHLKFWIPEGLLATEIQYAYSSDPKGEEPEVIEYEVEDLHRSEGLVTVQVAKTELNKYLKNVEGQDDPSGYAFWAYVRCRVAPGWLGTMLLSCLLVFFMLAALGIVEWATTKLSASEVEDVFYWQMPLQPTRHPYLVWPHSEGGNGALLGLLTIVPAVWALYAVRPNEHYAFAFAVRSYRIVLIGLVVMLLMFGVCVALNLEHSELMHIWWWLIVPALIGTGYVFAAWAATVIAGVEKNSVASSEEVEALNEGLSMDAEQPSP